MYDEFFKDNTSKPEPVSSKPKQTTEINLLDLWTLLIPCKSLRKAYQNPTKTLVPLQTFPILIYQHH